MREENESKTRRKTKETVKKEEALKNWGKNRSL